MDHPLPTPETPGASVIEHRVSYGETDRMSYVYYGHYPHWFEQGRTEWLREHGLRYRDLEESGRMLPVRSMRVRYHAPARYDELVRIVTDAVKTTKARMIFASAVYDADGALLAEGEVELACVDADGRPAPLPDSVRAEGASDPP